jgi:hypothetical protein
MDTTTSTTTYRAPNMPHGQDHGQEIGVLLLAAVALAGGLTALRMILGRPRKPRGRHW